MEKIFLSVLNMSLTASFVIAVIMLARLPLKKAPKIISYALWAVAGFRLVFPFTLESVFSLLPFKAAPIPQDIAIQVVPRIDSGIAIIDNAVSASLPAAVPYASVNPLQIWIFIGSYVWLFGVAVMLIYSFVSIILLKRKLRGAALIEGNLYEVGNLKTPFVIGLFRPKIYIPAGLTDEERNYIVLHERTHIRRGDHIVKMFAYFLLCLHWFNPLAWVAFILMGADMEMSCDERVMRELGENIKNAYSFSLVRVAAGRKILNGSPLAFGEGGMKERVKNVLNFKKPSRIIIVLAVALMAVLSVGFAVNQVSGKQPFKDINSDEITSILLYCSPPDVSVSIEDKSTISEIAEILRTVVTYEKDYLGEMYAGQLVQYTLTMQSGEAIEIGALGSFIVIDGQRYKTKYEPSEELNRLGNQLRGDKKSPYQQAMDIINEHYPEASEIISSGSETIIYADSSESVDVYTFEVVIKGERVICAISKDSSIFFTYNDITGWALPSLGDRRPMVLIEDLIYMDTGKDVSVETDKITPLGTILSSVDASEIPTQNGQSNFGCVGSDYAYYEDGIIVKINGKWFFFVAESLDEAQEMQDTEYNISLSNLRQLAAKGDELIFEDFSKYKGQDVGFGAYILYFEIEGGYELLVGGSTITGKPMNATLSVPGVEDNIDIRYENIDEFIGKYPIMPQDIGTDWATYDRNGNLMYYHTIDENGNDVYSDFEPEKTKANTEMNGHYFVNETIDCINGESGEHKESNGRMATYTNDGGTWSLESGQEVTITFRVKAVEGHESGQGIVFGYLKDGIYTQYSESRLLNETSLSFTATEDGEYCFFFINASSDTIYVENCTISK